MGDCASEITMGSMVTKHLMHLKRSSVENDMEYFRNGEINALDDILSMMEIFDLNEFIKACLKKYDELMDALQNCTKMDQDIVNTLAGYESAIYDVLLLLKPSIEEEYLIIGNVRDRINEL